MQILGILAFVVALLLSVMIHEFGHYLTAKHYGMKVSEFFLGFGTRIWSRQRGETEFGVKAIPAGGYCRIEGMTPGDQMPAGEEGRAFYKAPSHRKLIVLGAGSFLHFVIGYLLLFTLFAAIGTSQVLPVVHEVLKGSAAQSAGFMAGDEITSINGKKVIDLCFCLGCLFLVKQVFGLIHFLSLHGNSRKGNCYKQKCFFHLLIFIFSIIARTIEVLVSGVKLKRQG